MDISQQILDITSSYGGGDSTRPSFNRINYVKHGSTSEALDLGTLDDLDLYVDGEIGSAHGSSTIFYRFRTEQPLQIAARVLPAQPSLRGLLTTSSSQASRPTIGLSSSDAQRPFSPLYLYIALSLTDASGQPIPTGALAFRPLAEAGERPDFTEVPVEISYAKSGYWENEIEYVLTGFWNESYVEQNQGYAEQDGVTIMVLVPILYFSEFDAVVVQGLLEFETFTTQTIVGPVSVSPVLDYRPIDTGRVALEVPSVSAGEFTLAVSSSQWSAIPYTLHLALRAPAPLRGTALLQLETKGRIPIRAASGEALLRLDSQGFIPRSWALVGTATQELRPTGTIKRTSPFA